MAELVSERRGMPAQLATIPLKLIQPHPKLAFRFRYDVAALADSIRSAADVNTPNGQLNPGRVVLRGDGEGYYVYVGVRRYLALKSLYEETKAERFAVYNAYIDTDVSELQMFMKAKSENEEEKGERQGVSVLEEVSGIGRIRDSIGKAELEKDLKRLLEVASRLSDERAMKLYDIERASRFRFRLAHLERLCAIEDDREFYLAAASTAGFRFSGDEIESAVQAKEAAYNLDWFKGVFPDYVTNAPAQSVAQEGGGAGEDGEERKLHLEVHEEAVIVVPCPRCGGKNMLQLNGEIKATHLSSDPEGERETEVTETVSRVGCKCLGCQGEFYTFLKHVGGKTYAVEPSPSKKFREPRATVEALDLRFDFDRKVWQKIVGEKVVGLVCPSSRKK